MFEFFHGKICLGAHWKRLIETFPMSTQNKCFCREIKYSNLDTSHKECRDMILMKLSGRDGLRIFGKGVQIIKGGLIC